MPRKPKTPRPRTPALGRAPGTNSRNHKIYLAVCLAVAGLGASAGVPMLYLDRARASEGELIANGMAAHVARTGLTEAVNWLRRQPQQPVTRFEPGRDESIDPDIGLVREFAIAPGVFGRYEVWRSPTTDDIVNEVVDPLEVERKELHAEDLSETLGHPAIGEVWRLKCVGFVFPKNSPDEPFDRHSHSILERKVLTVEVGRFGLCLPGQAALCARNGSNVRIERSGRLRGGDDAAGLYFGALTADAPPPVVAAGSVSGVRPLVGARSEQLYDDSVQAVFGVDRNTLIAMADQRVTTTMEFPWDLQPQSLYVVQIPQLTLTSTRPLRGGGVVYVEGDLTLSAGSEGPAADFAGLLYVDGDLTIDAEASLRGAVVVTGAVKLLGGRREAAVDFDDGVLRTLRCAVGAYRMRSAIAPLHAEEWVSQAKRYAQLRKARAEMQARTRAGTETPTQVGPQAGTQAPTQAPAKNENQKQGQVR